MMRPVFALLCVLLLAGCAAREPPADEASTESPVAPAVPTDTAEPGDVVEAPDNGTTPPVEAPNGTPDLPPDTPWRTLPLQAGGPGAVAVFPADAFDGDVMMLPPIETPGLQFLGLMGFGGEPLQLVDHVGHIGFSHFEGPFADAFRQALPATNGTLVLNTSGVDWIVVAAKAAGPIDVALRSHVGQEEAAARDGLARQGTLPMVYQQVRGVHAAAYVTVGFAGTPDDPQIVMMTEDATPPEWTPLSAALPGDVAVFRTEVDWAGWSHVEAVGNDQAQRTFQFLVEADVQGEAVEEEGTRLVAGLCDQEVCLMPDQHTVVIEADGGQGATAEITMQWIGSGGRMALAYVHIAFAASLEELTGASFEPLVVMPGEHLDVGPFAPPVA